MGNIQKRLGGAYRTPEEIYLGWSNFVNEQAGEIYLKQPQFLSLQWSPL